MARMGPIIASVMATQLYSDTVPARFGTLAGSVPALVETNQDAKENAFAVDVLRALPRIEARLAK